jgi:hypothetical protein
MLKRFSISVAVLASVAGLTGCVTSKAQQTLLQNNPGLQLENRRADSTFQVSTFDMVYSQGYYRDPSTRTTKIVSAIFYTKVFKQQEKLAWCDGYSAADANDLELVASRVGRFESYLEVDAPQSAQTPRMWTGPFISNKSNRLEDVVTSCAVTTHAWLPAHETAKLSVHLKMDIDIRIPNRP